MLNRSARAAMELDAYSAVGIAGLCAGFLWALLDRHDAGVTLDEPSEMRYGRRIAAWFISGFRDQRAVFGDRVLAHYGGLFEALAQVAIHFTPHDPVGTRHAASALCALAGIAAAWKMAEQLLDRRAGLVAAVLLASTPAWVGHGLFNPKDIPFGAAAAWGTWGVLRIATAAGLPSYRAHLVCGVALGAALGVRPGGMFLLAYPLFAWVGRWLLLIQHRNRNNSAPDERLSKRLLQATARLCVCWLAAWVCMLIAWPWAQLSPIQHPVEALLFAAHSTWGGSMLFEGHYISAQHLPASYLPVWFAITLPETYALAAACACALIWLAWRRRTPLRRQQLGVACVAMAAFAPVAAQVVTHSRIYDAQRHFLFVLPPLAALAGAALTRFWLEPAVPSSLRAAVAAGLLGVLTVVAIDMVHLHPYEYVYFNRFAGGLPGAASRYETEYWGASYIEGLRWLAAQLSPKDRSKIRVATCNHDESVRLFLSGQPRLAERFQLERRTDADILLATTRNNCHKTQGRVLHIVQRMGVPFLYVIERHALLSNTLSEPNGPKSQHTGG